MASIVLGDSQERACQYRVEVRDKQIKGLNGASNKTMLEFFTHRRSKSINT